MLEQPLVKLNSLIRAGKLKPAALLDEAYANIDAYNGKLNAYLNVLPRAEADKALQSAAPASPLYGIPFSMKDAYVTRSLKTTAASAVLRDYRPQYDATVYTRLAHAGAILIAKANLDAWGHGASTENNDFGVTRNPWDGTRVAGGSSGGSAAAIAAGMCQFSVGEDTGGSIRNPAAWTNCTGLKVTYGRVSRYGAIAYASSFDTVGPMGSSVEDVAYLLQVMAGQDPYDATSSPEPVGEYVQDLKRPVSQLKVGIPLEMVGEGLDSEIKQAVLSAADKFSELGVEIIDVSLPIAEIALAAYYLIGPSETSSNLARYDGIRYGQGRELFTTESIRRILIGTYALSAGYYDAYYRNAQRVRTLLIRKYEEAFAKCDILLMPVNPTHAPRLGELVNDPITNMLADIYTTSINQVGVPSLALPCGFSREGLPIGMQLVGRKFGENVILNLGYQYQQVTDWHTRKPQL